MGNINNVRSIFLRKKGAGDSSRSRLFQGFDEFGFAESGIIGDAAFLGQLLQFFDGLRCEVRFDGGSGRCGFLDGDGRGLTTTAGWASGAVSFPQTVSVSGRLLSEPV